MLELLKVAAKDSMNLANDVKGILLSFSGYLWYELLLGSTSKVASSIRNFDIV
jgi:hypothetical protein